MPDKQHTIAGICSHSRILVLFLAFISMQCRQFRWPEEMPASHNSSNGNAAQTFAVVSTAPAGGATGVANNSAITVNFSLAANTAALSYQATAGACTGSLQVSADSFSTCIGFSSHAWNGTQNSVTLSLAVAMANSTTYQIRISIAMQGAGGETLAGVYTSSGFTTAAPGVLVPSMNTPTDGATGVSTSTPLVIDFTYAVNTGTLAYNSTAGACTGSVQFSVDGFSTCLALTTPVWSLGNTRLTLALGSALNYSLSYRVRVTTGLVGAAAETLSGTYTSVGFTTSGPPPLTIPSVTPADAATNVSFAAAITVNFSATMNTGTLTMNGTLGACSGSLQVSSDNFTTCIGLVSPTWNGSFNQLTVTPGVSLGPGIQYKIRVTTAASGTGGEVLTANYTTPTGFATTITAPTAFQVFNSAAKNMFVWQTVAGAANYNLYYATSPGVTTGTGTLISGVTAPYTHTGLTNGVTYYYIVAGANGAIVGQPSSEVSATPQAFKKIFVTSISYNGNLGGISGADANCGTRAAAVLLTGQFRAYLSDSTHDAVCRVLGLAGKLASNCGLPVAPDLTAIGPYQNRNGQVVNVNLDSLIYGKAPTTTTCSGGGPSLLNAVGYDEAAAPSSAQPFTGTQCGVQFGANCTDWTSGVLANAQLGVANATNSSWSSNGAVLACLAGAPLYCVEK